MFHVSLKSQAKTSKPETLCLPSWVKELSPASDGSLVPSAMAWAWYKSYWLIRSSFATAFLSGRPPLQELGTTFLSALPSDEVFDKDIDAVLESDGDVGEAGDRGGSRLLAASG